MAAWEDIDPAAETFDAFLAFDNAMTKAVSDVESGPEFDIGLLQDRQSDPTVHFPDPQAEAITEPFGSSLLNDPPMNPGTELPPLLNTPPLTLLNPPPMLQNPPPTLLNPPPTLLNPPSNDLSMEQFLSEIQEGSRRLSWSEDTDAIIMTVDDQVL